MKKMWKKYFIKSFSTTTHQSIFTLSVASGTTSPSLVYDTIGERLHKTSAKYKYEIALISNHQNIKYSWEEFNDKVTQAAASFIGIGLKPGDRVGIYAPNMAEWTITQFACSRAGLILVTINPAYQINDLKYALNKVGISTLIMTPSLKSSDYIHILNSITEGQITDESQDCLNLHLKDLPNLRQVILLESFKYDKKISLSFLTWENFYFNICKPDHMLELKIREKRISPEDPTNIQFTSGTTGLPKGALLSHFNILNNGFFVGRNINYTYKDNILIQVPLYHCFGTVMGNLAALNFGSTMVYPNYTFDPIKSLETIEKEKITSLYGVPTMFLEVLNHQQTLKKNVSSLRTGIMAGSICPKFLMDRCINELNLEDLSINYGMTELSPVTHATSIYDSLDKKTSTVGCLLPHTRTKIVDSEGNIIPRGEVGEICSKGYGLMLRYWEDEKATMATIDNEGYMKTGDLGKMDEEGYLYIEGRKKDTIIRGGENISPKELEDLIGTHQAVDDVQVIAVKDIKFGDEICAWIKLKPIFKGKVEKKEIQSYVKSKVAHFKVPRYIRFVDSFPMTITGKPQKYIMREISNKIIEEKSEEI
jgi:fatty-acyl-CoA synthase